MTYLHDQVLPKGTQIGVNEIKDASKIDPFSIIYRAWNHHFKGRVKLQEYFPYDLAIRGNDGLSVEPKAPSDKENFEYGLKAFLDQAEILTQIEHPNVATAENALPFNGTAYLIMDYQEGISLSKLVKSAASFTETELKFILVSILNALQKVHEYKLVHGGIQPETILLDKDGEPVLINFAAARLAIAARTDRLASELATGYAPIEQYEPIHEPGPATDFYALGATMYYCITYNQPADAQGRKIALSKDEPDPVASLSTSSDGAYSSDLLQTIDWMLRPEYNNRPQSATEILAALGSEPASDQAGTIVAEQTTHDVVDDASTTNIRLWVGATLGVVALAAIGWFLQSDEKTTELLDRKPAIVTAPPALKQNADQATAQPTEKENEVVDLADVGTTQEPDADKIAESAKKEMHDSEKQSVQTDEKPSQLAATDKVSPPSRQRSGQQISPKKPVDKDAIKRHLTAAEQAVKQFHLTTPAKNNAYEHYQMVLTMDPNNVEALAGLQKIIARYVQLIEKTSAKGERNTARVYLQRAETVFPDAPELRNIRAKLAPTEE